MRSRREAASEAERWEERFNTVEEASKQLIAESLDARRDGSFASNCTRALLQCCHLK